ncbi:MAG: cytochrome d ubiquinol oxidase subunit II [Bifidobacteriaceae bacterium]|jgi:cytochrome d ubiquinol oxidase subunit II|nr:cytochrome d ubiquinol oxidase subunit II [Bifidobacteriaceae bacterium]
MLNNILALAPAQVDPQVTEDTAKGLVELLRRLAEGPSGYEFLWFGLIAVLWTGYLVLEGFDFGVGMLLPIIGKRDNERRAMLSTIGPLWDGNEVWVLTAGGATFAAFPEWYATLFSAAYLPLFLILVGLIIRAVAFEYRGKINSGGWRTLWDWCIVLGSWIPAILWGVAFANLVAGVKADVNPAQLGSTKILYAGTFWDLVIAHQGFLLVGGLTTAALFLAHGAIFLSLKTDGVVRERSERLAPKLSIAATVIAAIWVLWLGLKFNGANHPSLVVWVGIGVAAIALVVVVLTTLSRRSGLAFTSMTVALLAAVVTIFAALFPNVINGSQITLKGDSVADPIVGKVVLGTENDGSGITVDDVVVATFAGLDPAALDAGAAPSEKAKELTSGILADVAAGTYPALGLLTQEQVTAAVDITFDRVRSLPDLSQVGTGEASQEAKDVTQAILADVAAGTSPVLGVINDANVVSTVAVTLLRNGLPADDATIGVVVADLVAGKDTIAGILPAGTVVAEVEKTVQAAIDQIAVTVQGVVDQVPVTLAAVAAATPEAETFHDGMDVTAIVTGEAWDNDLGLANLNGRIENANGALGALHALGILEGEYVPIEPLPERAVITGQPIHASASSQLTLELMTIVAICLVPIVLAYQAWSIYVFRRRITADRIPADSGLEPANR